MRDERKTKAQLIAEIEALRVRLAARIPERDDSGPDREGGRLPGGALLRVLFESMAEGMVLATPDGRIVEANPAAERILGLTRRELAEGESFMAWSYVDAAGRPVPVEETAGPRALREGRPVRVDLLGIRRRDGEIVWVTGSATPIRGENGEPVGVVGTFSDVTERKLAEEALRESQEKFRAQYKGIPVPAYTWQRRGDDLVLVDYNDAAGELTRGRIAGLVGMKATEMYPDKPEILNELRSCVLEKVRIERVMPYEFRTLGKTKILSVRYVPVPPDLVMVHTEDITARVDAEKALRLSEERLRSTLSSMDDLVFVLDDELRFLSFVQPERTASLYVQPADYLGKTIEEVLPPRVASMGRLAAEQALATGEVQQFDYALDFAGEERWYSAKVSARRGVEGEPAGVTLVAREITKRKRAERELAEAHATLEQRVQERTRELLRLREKAEQLAAMRERERLARDLHDAVTQTLFSVSLIADALPALWEKDPAAGRSQLAELGAMTRGALAEMRGLLLELRPKALEESSLGDLLRRLAGAIEGRTGLRIELDIDEEEIIDAEPKEAFYRIAQESLNNVVKHAAAAAAELRLRQRPGRIELRVRDEGRGFDRAMVPPGRLGLGIMEERAGSVGALLSIVSRPGEGTVVSAVWVESEETEG